MEKTIKDFAGFNNKNPQINLSSQLFSDCNNVLISKYNGVVSKIPGFKVFSGSHIGLNAMGLYFARLYLNSSQLLAYSNVKINLYDGLSDFNAIHHIAPSGSNQNLFSSCVAIDYTVTPQKEYIIITNGNDDIYEFDVAAAGNTAWLLGLNNTKAKFANWWKNRLWLSYITDSSGDSFPRRIQWCVIGDPDNYTGYGSGSRDLSLNNGESIVGSIVYGDFLAVFCTFSIVVLSYVGGSGIIAEQRFETLMSCVAPNSLIAVGNKIFFMSKYGLAVFNGQAVSLVTYNNWINDLNQEFLYSCYSGLLIEYQLILFLYSSLSTGVHNKVLYYDFAKNTITFGDMDYRAIGEYDLESVSTNIGSMAQTIGSDSRTLLEAGQSTKTPILVGINNDNYVYRIGIGKTNTDSATPISSFFEGGWENLGSSAILKRMLRVHIVGLKHDNNILLHLYVDGNKTPKVSLTISMYSTNDIVVTQNDVDFSFRFIRYRIENNGISESFDIQEIIYSYEMTESTQ